MTENDYPLRPQGRLPESSGTHRPREFFETIAGPDATPYPAEVDEPNVYYARRLKNVRFTETVGQQTLTYDTTEDKRFIFNMEAEKYIEEGSIISCWRQNGQWWTIDKVRQEELLVLCHARGATSHSAGSVSRLDPITGDVVWTFDLGTDPDVGAARVGYSVDIDSRGNIYVAWQVSTSSGIGPPYIGATGAAGGIVKLNRNGTQLASHTFPPRHTDFSVAGVINGQNAQVRVDPENNDRIYFAGDYDDDGYWLYRLDADLNVVWGAGPAEIDAAAEGSSVGLAITPDGHLFVVNAPTTKVFKVDVSGSLVGSLSPSLGNLKAVAADPSSRLRAGGGQSNPGSVLIGGYQANLTGQWTKVLNDFSMAPPAGSWAGPVGGYSANIKTMLYDGANILCGLGADSAIWNVTAGGTRTASILRLSSDGGVVLDAFGWGNWTGGGGSSVFGAAHNAVTNSTFLAGAASNSGNKMAGKLGGWESQVLTTNPGLLAWGIAVRTVR
jgi:hypothetical protein